jgi:tetratricopeptide (TPR) repeat protein
VAVDREDTLKKAEKLLRQGRLDAAIAEYVRVVEDHPGDAAVANTLGDLYVRAGQQDKAAAQYARIGAHFMAEGFYSKAGAIYKKALKLTPEDEAVQLSLADIAQKQGLLADARTQLQAIAARRRQRGDKAGVAEIVVRLGSVDAGDFDARTLAARTLVEMGDEEDASARFRGLYEDLLEKDRGADALEALREAVRLNPYDQPSRTILARTAVHAGDFEGARAFLDRETAGNDPAMLMALLEMHLRSGALGEARELLPGLLEAGREQRQPLADLSWATAGAHPDAAFLVIEALADAAVAESHFAEAAALLQEFAVRVPNQIPALLKLVQMCVDGGLEFAMHEAQALLADAYLGAGRPTEARTIAEDLVAREPWQRAHIDRFRRALVMLRVPEPDTVIATRLSGDAPFTAKDMFAEREVAATAAEVNPQAGIRASEAPPAASADPGGAEIPAMTADPAGAQPPAEAARPGSEPSDEVDLSDALGGFDLAQQPQRISRSRTPDVEAGQHVDPATGRQNPDQSAQHMTLARTYLEMGLADEAIGPLETASRTPRFRFEAASTLGRLFQGRGDSAKAVEWLERAAEAPAPSDEESRALLYDLGALIESSGDTARALAIFLELQADAGDYRDVAERVERLARVETGG